MNVVQLETAVGSAIHNFEGSIGINSGRFSILAIAIHLNSREVITDDAYHFISGINVPRTRFLPVKKTSDLLLVMSNLYSLSAGSLCMNPKRSFPSTPLVKLGSQFDKVDATNKSKFGFSWPS